MDGEAVRRWCHLGAEALAQARAAIDALNVFPVPDADTGTNLHITLMAAAEAVNSLPAGAASAQVWEAAAQGALLGACGNSGIIVSQMFRGLADVCGPESRCDGAVLARALAHAAASARAAVSRPARGTVLTVADAAAEAGIRAARADPSAPGGEPGDGGLAAVVTAVAAAAREALAGTPEQLDVLAASGVVDAGAAGLCVLLDALAATVTGAAAEAFEVPAASRPVTSAAPGSSPRTSPGYEVTYLLDAPPESVARLRERLDALGDSLVIVGGAELWHVHVHVPDAGAAIEAGMLGGRPHRITVTWLGAPVQGEPVRAEREAGGGRGVVAVAESEGLASLLRGGGARVLRQDGGGPAVPALVEAIRQAGAQVAVIPSADRVARLAHAAAARLGDEGLRVSVIPARSPLQGIAALAVHDPERGFDADVAAMSQAVAGMRYGSVTGPAGAGFTGLVGDEAQVAAGTQRDVAAALAGLLLAPGGELVTLMEGAGAEPGLARAVAEQVARVSPEAEVVCYEGGPVPLLIGVE